MLHAPPAARPLLLGHRGARRAAPENTLAAFELALRHGCHGFEFDVRRTADGRAVICHDPRLAGLEVARATCAELVQHHRRLAGDAAIPCLEDVLARFAARAYLDIELKVTGLEEAVLAALRENPPQRGYLVSSFLAEVVQGIRARDPAVPVGFICDQKRALARWPALPVVAVLPQRSLVGRALVEEIHAAGRKVFVWTVNQRREMLRLAEWGVDGIISDDTELLGHTLEAGPGRT